MISLFRLLSEALITLKPIEEFQSEFGSSYKSKFVEGPHLFFELVVAVNEVVGEIEYGLVDENTIEVISIHVHKEHRGKYYAGDAINALAHVLHQKTIIVMVTPSSKKFWTKLGFTPLKGENKYYTKTF